uniref:Uncharacterized protein n=1 Tax=Tanacetum cinerariifolium TaxID=118510 RepID=A0A6L2LG49_TANCI|nr:hypothetical protein [Tanacetum cinerariifolium]
MTLEEIKEKFDPVWKQIQDFIPIGSKEETKRFKRKGLRLEQESVKKLKTLEEVKATEEVPKEKVKEMMQLVPVKEIYVEALQVKHPIIDWKHFDREDLNHLWGLVKETLSIRPAISDKEKELWHEHYALWEVIEFGDSYEAPKEDAATALASDGSAKKKGRTVAVTTEDMQKRKNDVKARTTLLLSLPDEHQSRFSKYKTA